MFKQGRGRDDPRGGSPITSPGKGQPRPTHSICPCRHFQGCGAGGEGGASQSGDGVARVWSWCSSCHAMRFPFWRLADTD